MGIYLKIGSKEPKLERDINLFEAIIYGIGIILGAGIYALIGKVYGSAGGASWIAFIVAAVIALMTGLSYAELSSVFPKSAAEYTYVKEAFPNKKAFQFTVGWILIFSGFISIATVALGFAGYLSSWMGAGSLIIIAVVLIAILTVVNFIGIEESAKLNMVFTFVEAAGVIFIIVIGFMGYGALGPVDFFPVNSSTAILGILSATALIFFAYIGFEDIANIAEETENPTKTIPRALMISIVVTTILYVLVALAIASTGVDPDALAASPNPFAYIAAGLFGSQISMTIISIIALFATANTVLIMLIVGSRMMYGMSVAGALPKIFSKVHKKTKTPWVAIIFTMVVSFGFVFLGDIELVARVSVFAIFIVFAIVNFVLIYLRKTQPDLERPFKVKPSIKWLPIFPLIGVVTCFLMLFTFADAPADYILILSIEGIVVAIGLGFYFIQKLYRRLRKKDVNMEF